MEFLGTKGKWHVYHNSQGYNSFNINSKYKAISLEEEHANALLISKAPEMLEMIRDLATNWDCDEDSHKHNTPCRVCEAEKLIKQATNI